MNANPTQWERQLAAARAYAKLSAEDKAALEAFDKATRNALHYDLWDVSPAERRALGGVPFVALKEAIHEARPDVTIVIRLRQNGTTEMQVHRQEGESIFVYGFNGEGEVGADGLWLETRVGGETTLESGITNFDPVAIADRIARVLSRPPATRAYAHLTAPPAPTEASPEASELGQEG